MNTLLMILLAFVIALFGYITYTDEDFKKQPQLFYFFIVVWVFTAVRLWF